MLSLLDCVLYSGVQFAKCLGLRVVCVDSRDPPLELVSIVLPLPHFFPTFFSTCPWLFYSSHSLTHTMTPTGKRSEIPARCRSQHLLHRRGGPLVDQSGHLENRRARRRLHRRDRCDPRFHIWVGTRTQTWPSHGCGTTEYADSDPVCTREFLSESTMDCATGSQLPFHVPFPLTPRVPSTAHLPRHHSERIPARRSSDRQGDGRSSRRKGYRSQDGSVPARKDRTAHGELAQARVEPLFWEREACHARSKLLHSPSCERGKKTNYEMKAC